MKEKKSQWLEGIGALLFILGLGGMGSACEGQGSFMVAAIVFSIGFGISLHNLIYGGN